MRRSDVKADRGGYWVFAQMILLSLHFVLPWAWRGPFSRGGLMEGPMRWIALPFGLMGFILLLAGFLKLGANLTAFPRPLETGALVDRGAYAVVRHPIYSGLLFTGLSYALVWNAALPLASWAVLLIFFDRKAAREEEWLMEKYPGYGDYRKRVRKLVPFTY
jgi:protein-S-isoprenylcysteine O-methyltransferase Ste14